MQIETLKGIAACQIDCLRSKPFALNIRFAKNNPKLSPAMPPIDAPQPNITDVSVLWTNFDGKIKRILIFMQPSKPLLVFEFSYWARPIQQTHQFWIVCPGTCMYQVATIQNGQ